MTLITNDAKVKHLDEYNELQLKHLKARVGVWESLHMVAMMLALAVVAVMLTGGLWGLVLLLRLLL